MVEKIAFLFPGQGSQAVGMGKSAYEGSTKAKDLIDRSGEILGFDLRGLMFNGPEEDLKETENTQPALFVVSAAALELLNEKNVRPVAVAGHSLGEYSALYAAGVWDFETALRLVRKRGEAMRNAGKENKGAMAAILGLKLNVLASICRSVTEEGDLCVPANFNSETQIVVSGGEDGVKKTMLKAKEAGALKVVPLTVSAAFHSPLMRTATTVMKEELGGAAFHPPAFPVITNVDASPTTDPTQIREKLIRQIENPVRWNDTMKTLKGLGITSAIEVGPGKVLGTLMKKFDRSLNVIWPDDVSSLSTSAS